MCVQISEFGFQHMLLSSLKYVWKLSVSSNIQVFAWRLIHHTLQTRDELANKGVISGMHNLVCLLCFGPNETHHPFFIACHVVVEVWLSNMDWVG